MLWLVPREDLGGILVWYYRFSYRQPHQNAVAVNDLMAEAA